MVPLIYREGSKNARTSFEVAAWSLSSFESELRSRERAYRCPKRRQPTADPHPWLMSACNNLFQASLSAHARLCNQVRLRRSGAACGAHPPSRSLPASTTAVFQNSNDTEASLATARLSERATQAAMTGSCTRHYVVAATNPLRHGTGAVHCHTYPSLAHLGHFSKIGACAALGATP